METNKKDSKKKKTEFSKLKLQVEEAIKEINTHICSAQAHLLEKSKEIIQSQKEMEIALPTVFRQVINKEGKSEMQKISETKLPFGYLIPPGIFQIKNIDVELPINFEDKTLSNKKLKPTSGSLENDRSTNVTLRLSYEYQSLLQVTEPIILNSNPIIELVFEQFEIDSKNKKKCNAIGYVEVKDEITGKPIESKQIFLNIDEGNIIPSVGKLNEKGVLKFNIIGNCQEDKKFVADVLVVINGAKRTFNVLLTQ